MNDRSPDSHSKLNAPLTTRSRQRSEEWFERAQQFLVEGVNSPSRGAAVYSPGPVVIERGQGSHIWDLDGNEYIDFLMAFGALIHGHAHPKLVEVVARAVAEGTHFAAATPAETRAAEGLLRMVPNAEVVRFANSGSEATMLALRLARAQTGRTKFLKFEGHYHGWYDPYLLSAHPHPSRQLGSKESPARIPDSRGIPATTFEDVVLAPWNDFSALERVMKEQGHQLAAVISEAVMANMGSIPPRPGYLDRIRQLTRKSGALFILDEVVTGFRYAPGGAQQFYGFEPDITAFGKALGAGFPIGAVAGRRSILERMRWGDEMVLHYGTFNGHRLIMEVVAANMDLLSAPGVYERLHEVGDAAISGLREVFRRRHMPAIVQGFGPMFQIYFTDREGIYDYRDYCAYVDAARYARFVNHLIDDGIFMTPSNSLHWIISTAHSDQDIEIFLQAVDRACAKLT